jgi:hypothetical protein
VTEIVEIVEIAAEIVLEKGIHLEQGNHLGRILFVHSVKKTQTFQVVEDCWRKKRRSY